MNVSIVIPVYNEADRLAACLEAIGRQSVPAFEVIVIDNNSSDATARVAASFSFVTLLHESKQGVAHARNTGFDAARGEIIGRIDADTLLPADWIAKVQSIFEGKAVSAVSGAPHYYDFALDNVADSIDRCLRRHLAKALGNDNFLWGANMAVRRQDWLKVRQELCIEPELHEDFDLGIHLQGHGLRVEYDPGLLAGVSARRIDMSFLDFVRYTLASPRTYARHNIFSRWHMYPILVLCWLGWLPGRAIYHAHDPAKGAYSRRIDPTTNIVQS
jgi:glycosyltransferase involved in cell wall biosynthesis